MNQSLLEMDRMQRLRLCVESIAEKDGGTADHCERVTDLVERLAFVLGLPDEMRPDLRAASLIHDIGKLAIPHAILLKPGRLDQAEWYIMRQHPVIGARLATRLELPRILCDVVLHHHEHWDGSGYPLGLRGIEIPLSARVLCVADVFDALTSDRCYRCALDGDTALRVMEREAGTILDPDIYRVFQRMIRSDAKAFLKAC